MLSCGPRTIPRALRSGAQRDTSAGLLHSLVPHSTMRRVAGLARTVAWVRRRVVVPHIAASRMRKPLLTLLAVNVPWSAQVPRPHGPPCALHDALFWARGVQTQVQHAAPVVVAPLHQADSSDSSDTRALTPSKVVELLDKYIVGQARTPGERAHGSVRRRWRAVAVVAPWGSSHHVASLGAPATRRCATERVLILLPLCVHCFVCTERREACGGGGVAQPVAST